MTSPELIQLIGQRLAICRACPHLQKGLVCGKCHCPMALKISKPNAKCPIGKW
jgi:hypothetical protein